MAGNSTRYKPCQRFYVMYHGTNFSAATNIIQHGFRQSSDGLLGKGVYVTRDEKKARLHPSNTSEQVILKLSVKVGRVKRIDAQCAHMAKTWHDNGYNTAWVPPNSGIVQRGLEEDCVWNPHRIKVIDIVYTAIPQHMQYLKELLAQK